MKENVVVPRAGLFGKNNVHLKINFFSRNYVKDRIIRMTLLKSTNKRLKYLKETHYLDRNLYITFPYT